MAASHVYFWEQAEIASLVIGAVWALAIAGIALWKGEFKTLDGPCRRTEQPGKFWLVVGTCFLGAAIAFAGVISAVSGSRISN
jgi:hypothetical protein